MAETLTNFYMFSLFWDTARRNIFFNLYPQFTIGTLIQSNMDMFLYQYYGVVLELCPYHYQLFYVQSYTHQTEEMPQLDDENGSGSKNFWLILLAFAQTFIIVFLSLQFLVRNWYHTFICSISCLFVSLNMG